MKKMTGTAVAIAMAAGAILTWYVALTAPGNEQALYISTLAEATQLEQKEIYVDAAEKYRAALAIRPNDYDTLIKYAGNLQKLGDFKGFLRSCEQAALVQPNNPEPYLLQARHYISLKKYDNAIMVLQLGLELQENEEMKALLESICHQYVNLYLSFEQICGFKDGYFAVKSNEKWGAITESGRWAVRNGYDTIGSFDPKELVFPVSRGGEYFYVDEDGNRKLVGNHPYDFLGSFGDGFAPAAYNGKYGYINRSFEEFSFVYDKAGAFANGVAAVCQGNKWGLINPQQAPITTLCFDEILLDEYGFCSRFGGIFARVGTDWTLLDVQGKQLGTQSYQQVQPFASQQPAAVCRDGKWGFLALDGQEVIPPTYKAAHSFSAGHGPVSTGDRWGAINLQGQLVIKEELRELQSFSPGGYAPARMVADWSLVKLYGVTP